MIKTSLINMNMKEAINVLENLSNVLKKQGYTITSRWIEHVATNLNKGVIVPDKDWEDIIDSFKTEYIKGNAFRKQLFQEIENIIVSAVILKDGSLSRKLLEVYPFFNSWALTQKNIKILGEIFLKLDEKEQCFGLCVAYLIEVEGSYDEVIRILYSLKQYSLGVNIALSDIEKMSITQLKDSLLKLGVSNILFEGYNRHLRNAIAHAHFDYDEKRKQMEFANIYLGKERWRDSFTFSEFNEMLKKLDDVDHLFTQIILLLRVHDIIKSFSH